MDKFDDKFGLEAAMQQARKSAAEGGVPIGAALVSCLDGVLKVEGASHNQRVQKGSAILHGETSALEAAGRLRADVYRSSTMVCSVSSSLEHLSHIYSDILEVHNSKV